MSSPLTKHSRQVGAFAVLLYGICLIWKFPISDPEVLNLHLLLLKLSFPGFSGFTAGSIVWGGVLAFVYGTLASIVFHKLHKNCCLPK